MARFSRLFLGGLLVAGSFGIGCDEAPATTTVAGALRLDPCRPFALLLDADVSAARREGARAALDGWNAVAVVRGSLGTSLGLAMPLLPLEFQAAAAPSHGFFDPERGEIFVNEDLSGAPLRVTIAHELGHALGLAHVSGRPSVMNVGNVSLAPNAEDGAALAVAWGACATVGANL